MSGGHRIDPNRGEMVIWILRPTIEPLPQEEPTESRKSRFLEWFSYFAERAIEAWLFYLFIWAILYYVISPVWKHLIVPVWGHLISPNKFAIFMIFLLGAIPLFFILSKERKDEPDRAVMPTHVGENLQLPPLKKGSVYEAKPIWMSETRLVFAGTVSGVDRELNIADIVEIVSDDATNPSSLFIESFGATIKFISSELSTLQSKLFFLRPDLIEPDE